MTEGWRRHDLLRVKPSAWSKILDDLPAIAQLPLIADWASQRRPLIVRRRTEKDDPGMIPVALSLPPLYGKKRIALQVASDAVLEPIRPLHLRLSRVPALWRETAKRILVVTGLVGIEPLVFGSLLWQELTGLPYLSEDSDLDLLWPVTEASQASWLVSMLETIAGDSAVSIDGEILMPGGGGVQWREWLQNSPDLLVKTMSGVSLESREKILTEWHQANENASYVANR